MKASMDAYDAARENVIKMTRDVQKLSKQAIFSLHRGDLAKAATQLDEAKEKAAAIEKGYIIARPTLRSGSYSNAMEEYAEAKLFEAWLKNKLLLLPKSEEMACVNNEEYLGGVIDFTGEIGRFAVACATNRDEAGVKCVLDTDTQVFIHLFFAPTILCPCCCSLVDYLSRD
jgi:predicted translin family RNA/ssDNA-binding protein